MKKTIQTKYFLVADVDYDYFFGEAVKLFRRIIQHKALNNKMYADFNEYEKIEEIY